MLLEAARKFGTLSPVVTWKMEKIPSGCKSLSEESPGKRCDIPIAASSTWEKEKDGLGRYY